MKSEIIKGCLIKAFKNKEVGSIAHCSNCFCSFGPVIAQTIKFNFPEAYAADLKTTRGSKEKLGTYSFAKNAHGTIFNIYAQYDYSSGKLPKQHVSYEALESGLKKVRVHCEKNNISSIGFPRGIGSGRAGGDRTVIEKMIDDVFGDSEIVVKLYEI